jgi:hypothetical protein
MQRSIMIVSLLLACCSSALACTCRTRPPDVDSPRTIAEWYLKDATVVFEGKVEDIRLPEWPPKVVPGHPEWEGIGLEIEFSGAHFYRGGSGETATIRTAIGGSDCGYEFRKNVSYLVHARKGPTGRLETDLCMGTLSLEDAAMELRLLRGEPPALEDLHRSPPRHPLRLSELPDPDSQTLCGKVSFPAGGTWKPEVSGRVGLLLWRTDEGPFPLRNVGATTQDDGSYCFYSLDPGEYIVGASTTSVNASSQYFAYYPGATEFSKAVPVTVGEPRKKAQASFSLTGTRLFTVRGYLRGAPEKAAHSTLIVFLPVAPNPFDDHYSYTGLGPQGRFEFSNAFPGRYIVYAVTEDRTGITILSPGVEINVTEDIEGVLLGYVAPK